MRSLRLDWSNVVGRSEVMAARTVSDRIASVFAAADEEDAVSGNEVVCEAAAAHTRRMQATATPARRVGAPSGLTQRA
jgi:hypothetical protein